MLKTVVSQLGRTVMLKILNASCKLDCYFLTAQEYVTDWTDFSFEDGVCALSLRARVGVDNIIQFTHRDYFHLTRHLFLNTKIEIKFVTNLQIFFNFSFSG
jgi:hypothetical protein